MYVDFAIPVPELPFVCGLNGFSGAYNPETKRYRIYGKADWGTRIILATGKNLTDTISGTIPELLNKYGKNL